MATAAPKIDLAQIAANMRQMNPNLQQTPAPTAAPSKPYSGTTSGYKPSTPAPVYNGTTSGYKPNTPAPPQQTAAPKPQQQGTSSQATKVPGGWQLADGTFVPVPNAGGTPAPPRPQEPGNFQWQPMPQTATPAPTTTPTPPAVDYKEQARVRTAELLKRKQTISTQQKGSLDQSFQRQNQITNDNRTLQDVNRQEVANPFSGKTAYDNAMIGRERTLADEAANNNLLAQKSNIDQLLADYENATADEQLRIADELQRADRAYQLDLSQFQLQQQGQNFNQNMATNQFNRGAFESDRGFNYGVGQDAIQNSRADRQLTNQEQSQNFNQNMQQNQFNRGILESDRGFGQSQQNMDFNQGMANRQLTNQEREQAFNQSQATKQQHIDLADRLSQQYGVPVYPTDDPMESYAQVAGLSSIVAQKLAEDIKQQGFDNTIKAALANNTITQTQASILNEAKQISISQQNANTSASSASTSRQNMESDNAYRERAFKADQEQRTIDNKYRESQSKTATVDPKTSTDNHGLLSQDINEANDAAEANALIEANRNSLTDADYKDLKKRVIDQF